MSQIIPNQAPDIVDELVAVAPGSFIDELRRRRPVTREQTQRAYDALFSPVDDGEVSSSERWIIAAFATRLAGASTSAAAGGTEFAGHYATRASAADPERATIALAEAAAAATAGPYGDYAESGLQGENTPGERYSAQPVRDALGARLAAALEHTHLLVFRPREASAAALDALLEAGWSIDGIVTISQLIAFLSYQQRVVAGLRVLAEEAAA